MSVFGEIFCMIFLERLVDECLELTEYMVRSHVTHVDDSCHKCE